MAFKHVEDMQSRALCNKIKHLRLCVSWAVPKTCQFCLFFACFANIMRASASNSAGAGGGNAGVCLNQIPLGIFVIKYLEQDKGIEPLWSSWKPDALPLS